MATSRRRRVGGLTELVDGVGQQLIRVLDDEHVTEASGVSLNLLGVESGRNVSSLAFVLLPGQNPEQDESDSSGTSLPVRDAHVRELGEVISGSVSLAVNVGMRLKHGRKKLMSVSPKFVLASWFEIFIQSEVDSR